MALLVRHVMTKSPLTVRPDTTLQAAAELMRHHDVRHLPVVDVGQHVLGILSDRDLLVLGLLAPRTLGLTRNGPAAEGTVGDHMTRLIHVIDTDDPAVQAATMMQHNKYDALPVLAAGRLVGIITSMDFVRYFAEHAEELDSEPGIVWQD